MTATDTGVREKGTSKDPLDTILHQAGDLGRAQILYLCVLGVLSLACAWHYFAQTIISVAQPYSCRAPGPSACTQWVVVQNKTSHEGNMSTSGGGWVSGRDDLDQVEMMEVECNAGWKFDFSHTPPTATSEFGWVCGSAWKIYAGQSAFYVGCALGTLGLGALADRVGRVPVLVMAHVLAALGNLATALAPRDLHLFALARMLAGTATDANFFMIYILVMEVLRPGQRSLLLHAVVGISYTAGCVTVPWLAVLAGGWRDFLLLVATPALLVLPLPLILPESARWRLAVGKGPHSALKTFHRIAAINGRKLTVQAEDDFHAAVKSLNSARTTGNLTSLFKTPRLRKMTCILLFKSMVLTLSYDAILRHMSLGPHPLAVFSLASLVILPGCLLVAVLQDRLGRKLLSFSALAICGAVVATGGLARALDAPEGVVTGLAMAARLAVTVAYNSGAQHAAELVPAEVQARGVAAVHVAGYVAAILAPQVLYLGQVWRPLPELVLGVVSIFGAALCLLLPETLNQTLPITLEDGEKFGLDVPPLLHFSCCKKSSTKL